MAAEWSLKVTNSNFEPQGEFVNVNNFKVDVALNKVRTFQMKFRLDNVLAQFVTQQSSFEPIYFQAFRNNVLLFNGPLMTMQETAEEENKAFVTINCAGPDSIFAKRLVATETPTTQIEGLKWPGSQAGMNHAKRFVELLDVSNLRANGETHIDYTTGPIKCTANGEYTSQSFKTIAEVLQDLYNQAEGFDWYVKPQDVVNSKLGRLIIEDAIGVNQPNAAFEYGSLTNNTVANYTRTADLSNQMNKGWNVSSAGPEATGAPTISKFDKEAEEKWGLKEAMVPLSALNISMREAITQEALNYRKRPRQTISISPLNSNAGTPEFEQDFGLGDFLPFRAIYEKEVRANLSVRCWGASYSVDETGKEAQTLLTSEE